VLVALGELFKPVPSCGRRGALSKRLPVSEQFLNRWFGGAARTTGIRVAARFTALHRDHRMGTENPDLCIRKAHGDHWSVSRPCGKTFKRAF
jgi:hypothetical protein